MRRQSHDSQLVSMRSYAGGGLALLAAIVANALLFYVLAVARTTPSLLRGSEAEAVPLAVMDLPVPEPQEPDIELPEADFLAVVIPQARTVEAQAIPEIATVLTPRLPSGIQAIGPDLPGLAMALPGPSDLRLIPSTSAPARESPLALSGVDRPPRKIAGASPHVPAWARRTRLEGKVTLRFVVTAEGQVADINVHHIEGDERFGREATRALATWRFEPATRRGKSVACWCFQTVNFTLSQ